MGTVHGLTVHNPLGNRKGFTLVEMIATLVIMGFITALAGMGMVSALESFLFARENTHMGQKMDYALNRINWELMNCSDITAASSTSLTYATTAEGLTGPRTLTLSGGQVTINNNVLLDRMGSYSGSLFLSYRQFDDTTWDAATDPFSSLAAIDVVLVISRLFGGMADLEYETSITLRNNRVANGPEPG